MKRTAAALGLILITTPASALHFGGPPSPPSGTVHCPAGYDMITRIPAPPGPGVPIPYPACVEAGAVPTPTVPQRCSGAKIPVWHRSARAWVCYP